jgi:hypothetical protein
MSHIPKTMHWIKIVGIKTIYKTISTITMYQYADITEKVGLGGKTSDVCSGGFWFEF